MSAPVDLNATAQQAADDGHAIALQVLLVLSLAREFLVGLNAMLPQVSAVLNEVVQIGKDADGVITSVHVKWPLK